MSSRFTRTMGCRLPLILSPQSGSNAPSIVETVVSNGGCGFICGNTNDYQNIRQYTPIGQLSRDWTAAVKLTQKKSLVGIGFHNQQKNHVDPVVIDQMMILKPSLFWIGGENADVYVRTINEFKTPKRGIKVFCEVDNLAHLPRGVDVAVVKYDGNPPPLLDCYDQHVNIACEVSNVEECSHALKMGFDAICVGNQFSFSKSLMESGIDSELSRFLGFFSKEEDISAVL